MTRPALKRLESLNWLLIYAGILVATAGLFVDGADEVLSNWLLAIGGVVFALGVAGIFLRAWLEREDPAAARRIRRDRR